MRKSQQLNVDNEGGYVIPKSIQPRLLEFLQYPERFGYILKGRTFYLNENVQEVLCEDHVSQ